jgi:hypothetical protein
MEEVCIKITDGVFIGNYKTSMSKTTLSNNNITHILCVGHEMENFWKDVIINDNIESRHINL